MDPLYAFQQKRDRATNKIQEKKKSQFGELGGHNQSECKKHERNISRAFWIV